MQHYITRTRSDNPRENERDARHESPETALVLLHFRFCAPCDDFVLLSIAFFGRRVGQAGSLRPIVNRPTFGGRRDAGGRPSRFAACRYAGQVGNLRRIVNPPRRRVNTSIRRRLATGVQDDILPH